MHASDPCAVYQRIASDKDAREGRPKNRGSGLFFLLGVARNLGPRAPKDTHKHSSHDDKSDADNTHEVQRLVEDKEGNTRDHGYRKASCDGIDKGEVAEFVSVGERGEINSVNDRACENANPGERFGCYRDSENPCAQKHAQGGDAHGGP